MNTERAKMAEERCRYNEQISALAAARTAALSRVETVVKSLRAVYQPLTQVLKLAATLGAIPEQDTVITTSALRRSLEGVSTAPPSMAPSRVPSRAPTPTHALNAPVVNEGFNVIDDRDDFMINHLIAMDNGHSNSFHPFNNSSSSGNHVLPNAASIGQSNLNDQIASSEFDNLHSSEIPEDPKERILQLSTSPSKNLIMAPFCVACQAYTANVAFINCGHVCLCAEHCDQMPVNEDMRKCPLCSKNSRVCKLTGLSRN